MHDELKKINENAKKYKWSPKFTLKEKVKVTIEEYLDDYEDHELTKSDFINYMSGSIADLVYPENEE